MLLRTADVENPCLRTSSGDFRAALRARTFLPGDQRPDFPMTSDGGGSSSVGGGDSNHSLRVRCWVL